MNSSKKVGTSGFKQRRYHAGIGFVLLPYGVDRADYLRECYTTGFITLIGEENNAISKVRCSREIIQNLDFPTSSEKLGSQVLYITLPKHKQLVAVSILDNIDEYSQLKENSFKLAKDTDSGYCIIEGDGKGNLLLSVNSTKASAGKLTVNVSNDEGEAELNLNVKGSVNLTSSAKITQISETEFELQVGESIINVQDGVVQITAEEIKHNEANEPMVLGDTLSEKIDKILDILLNAKTATTIGLQPLDPKSLADLTTLKTELIEFKSKKSKLE